MTKIVLQWVLVKTLRQDTWNILLKEKLNCFNYWIYRNFKSFICLLEYEYFTYFAFLEKFPGCRSMDVNQSWKSYNKTFRSHPSWKRLIDINRCLIDPANWCLTDTNSDYLILCTYPVLVIWLVSIIRSKYRLISVSLNQHFNRY